MSSTIKTFNDEIDKFIKYVFNKLVKHDVEIIISTKNYVIYPSDNLKCNGYYYTDENNDSRMFAFATGRPLNKWFPVFIHEFCHFEQWRTSAKVWDELEDEDELWDWVSRKIELSKRESNSMINHARNLEYDCELRTVAMIKKFNLPVDVEKYSQMSAAYILFYDYLKKYRTWYKIGKEPYRNKKLISIMPKKLPAISSRKLKLTPAMEKLYKECV